MPTRRANSQESSQHKNLPWEKDSIAKVAYDPVHIPDCNVQASVGQHFLFNEPIPSAWKILEASKYRSPTWCILRALQSIFQANVVVGESTITAAPFFEGVGRPSKPFWGPQQGRRVIQWESLHPEDQEKCLTELQSDRHWVIWCMVRPSRKTWPDNYSGSTVNVSLSANVRDKRRWSTIKQSPREANTLPGPEGGGRGGM
jgi:hypothetical protein